MKYIGLALAVVSIPINVYWITTPGNQNLAATVGGFLFGFGLMTFLIEVVITRMER